MTHPSDDPPSIDEIYSSAIHASNLKVEADRKGQIDSIIAAAWSPSRIGSALLRLHSEYDGSSHPRRIKREALEALALTLHGFPRDRDQKARRIASDWYEHEVALMLQRLKTLPNVRYQLTLQADKWLIDDPERTAVGVLIWWLDHTCPHCHGLKFEKVQGAPSLSARACRYCRGSGETPIPYSFEGRRLVEHVNTCIDLARRSIKKRLRP